MFRQKVTNLAQTFRIAAPLSFRKSAMVGLLRDHALKTHPMEIEGFHERIDHVDGIVLAYPIVQAFWQECQLRPVRASNETSHRILHQTMQES
jgi:hypothetical protein